MNFQILYKLILQLKKFKGFIIIAPILFLFACDKLPHIASKTTHLNCVGSIERGIYDENSTRQLFNTSKSNVTLTIDGQKIEMKGDGTQLEFTSEKTICTDTDEIQFDSNQCRTSSEQIENLMKLYQNNEIKALKAKEYEDHHKVRGVYNKINRTLYIDREDSSCYENNSSLTKSCGLYTVGTYKCESVKIE